VAFAAAGALFTSSLAMAAQVTTIKPGVLTVAVDNEMPFCQEENGKIVGTEGAIITEVAKRLGLTVEPAVMDWPAIIQSIQSGRVDVGICGMARTDERSKIIGLTDPIYNQVVDLTQRKGENVKSLADLKNKKFGTIQGFYYIPNFQKALGEDNVLLYNSFDAAYQDLVAGRIDVLTITGATSAWTAQQHPDWNLDVVALPEADYKTLDLAKNKTVFGVNITNTALRDALNAEIAEMKADGTVKAALDKYGLGSIGMDN
jgi:polar amino acid transport system substrate-binding protein